MIKFFIRMSLLPYLFIFSSCFNADAPPHNLNVSGEAISSGDRNCSIDSQAMDEFFTRNLQRELDCMRDQLHQYAQVNQVRDPQIIDEQELQLFLGRFFKTNSTLEKGLKDFFTIAYFLLNAPKGQIPVSKVNHLFEVLKATNQHGNVIYPLFEEILGKNKKITEEKFWASNLKLKSEMLALTKKISVIVKGEGEREQNFVIEDIMQMAWAQKNQKLLEDIKSLLFTKTLILGGEELEITTKEFLVFLEKSPQIVTIFHRLVGGGKVSFESEKSYAQLVYQSSKELRDLIYHTDGENEAYFELGRLVDSTHRFADILYDLTPLKNSILRLYRTSIFKGENGWVDANAIEIFLTHVEEICLRVIRFDDLWQVNEHLLERGILPQKEELQITPRTDAISIVHDVSFIHLVTGHPYTMGKDKLPTYGKVRRRDRRGLIELGIIDYLVKVFLNAHSSEKELLNEKEFLQIIYDYSDFVSHFGLWRNPPERMVKSNFLIANLFRHVSTTDDKADQDEIISSVVTNVVSSRLANELFPRLYEACLRDSECLVDEELEGISTEFFYKKFLDYFLSYHASFPEAYNQILKMSVLEKRDYLRNLARFTRHCPFDGPDYDIPIRKKDLILIFGGMISIEEIYLLMDSNNNSVIDFQELEMASKRFENAIVDFAKLPNWAKGLSRPIFFFMVVNQRMPESEGEVIKFAAQLRFMKKSKIKLNRTGVAKIASFFSTPDQVPHPDCYRKKSLPNSMTD